MPKPDPHVMAMTTLRWLLVITSVALVGVIIVGIWQPERVVWDRDGWAVFWSAFQGVFTLGAVAVALALGVVETRRERQRTAEERAEKVKAQERLAKQLEAEATEKRRHQSQRVAGWVKVASYDYYKSEAYTPYALNGSDMAIFHLTVFLTTPSQMTKLHIVGEEHLASSDMTDVLYRDLAVLPPGEKHEFDGANTEMNVIPEMPAEIPRLVFRDANNTWWVRDEHGNLRDRPDGKPEWATIFSSLEALYAFSNARTSGNFTPLMIWTTPQTRHTLLGTIRPISLQTVCLLTV